MNSLAEESVSSSEDEADTEYTKQIIDETAENKEIEQSSNDDCNDDDAPAMKKRKATIDTEKLKHKETGQSSNDGSNDSDDAPATKKRKATTDTDKLKHKETGQSSNDGSNDADDTSPPSKREDTADNENDNDWNGDESNMRLVASHYNELKESGRKERLKSRIVYMRNFNNWIKCQLINEYLKRISGQQRKGDPIRVLDMCCGKGGDLLKWEKGNITHLICTDIAEVSVDQCKKRYDDMLARADKTKFAKKFSAEFFACDSTLVRLRERYKDPSLKLNLVSCQFAFHYSFESLSQADCMVRNAAECLQSGGYFIATIPDAYEIMRRLRSSSNSRSFGNDVYNIDFVSDTNPPPLFGAKYQFHLEGVVDCPEFLVHFPTLVKLCRKHGLKLERKTTFADCYKEFFEHGRTLLQRMNGLETVFPNRLNNNDEQYGHVRNFIKSANMPPRPCGSLTKDEWEATTLYLVCAFKKCKNTWDAQGKPVFEFD